MFKCNDSLGDQKMANVWASKESRLLPHNRPPEVAKRKKGTRVVRGDRLLELHSGKEREG